MEDEVHTKGQETEIPQVRKTKDVKLIALEAKDFLQTPILFFKITF